MGKVKIDYRCQHISCRNPKCYKGTLSLETDVFDLLFETERDPKIFRSPSGYCFLGSVQLFEILSLDFEDGAKMSPVRVLEILRTKLLNTKEVKSQLDKQYLSIVEKKRKAEENIATLEKRIKETEALLLKE